MNNIITFPSLGLEFNINRAMFTIGDFSVYWYGVIISLGLILAVIYGYNECKRISFNTDDFFNMLIIAIPVAIVFARLYYVIFSWDLYKDDITSIIDIRSGGLAIYGGIIGAALTVIIYCTKKKIKIGIVLDMLAVGLLIGQSIGRWGNFVNGEAFGSATTLPWAMCVTSNGRQIANMVHPTFLYESLWNALGIIVLLVYKKYKKADGELFCAYMIWYGLGRSFIEGLRADSLFFGAVKVSQLLSVCILITGVIILSYLRKRSKK